MAGYRSRSESMKITKYNFQNRIDLKENGNLVASGTFKSAFSYEAVFVYGDRIITIKPQNSWNRKFDIIKDSIDQGDIIINWLGHAIIKLDSEIVLESHEFLLKKKKFWSQTYYLLSPDETDILSLKPSYGLTKTIYDVHVYSPKAPMLEELTLYAIYCIAIINKKASSG